MSELTEIIEDLQEEREGVQEVIERQERFLQRYLDADNVRIKESAEQTSIHVFYKHE